MKRIFLVGFTSLVMMAPLAGAMQSSTPATPASSTVDLSAEMSVQAPDCAKAALPFMVPDAEERSDHPTCGACSVAVCVGAYDGTVCGTALGGQYKYCRPTGPLCQDGPPADFRCTCTTTIVP